MALTNMLLVTAEDDWCSGVPSNEMVKLVQLFFELGM